jgi:hypothetical protein
LDNGQLQPGELERSAEIDGAAAEIEHAAATLHCAGP